MFGKIKIMKNILLLTFYLPIFLMAQEVNLNYEQTNDISFAKKFKNDTKINSYTTKDDLKISIGDTLTIGKAVIERKKYMINDVFSHIVIGDVKGTYIHDFKYLPHKYNGDQVIVKSMYVKHVKYEGYNVLKNRKEMPLYVNIFVTNLKTKSQSGLSGIKSMLKESRKTILDIEKALSSGEIINSNAQLSREEAIKKLKESKDLMELDLLSKQEYSKLKEKLTPIIMNEK